ncbi:MAG: restriction endonuclease subunit S, partial [Acinetobacter sp.]|nr:restriction endonuclease subunit S [Acinetobacter sp.]
MNNEKITLADALEFVVDNRGKTVPTTEKGFPLIATNCISNDNLYPSFLNVRYVSTDTYNNWFRSHPLPDDIIITNKGSQNGAVCFVPNPVTFCIAQDMVALRAKRDLIYPKFLFAALRSQEVQNQIKNLNVDGVIPHFKKADFNKLKLPNPCYKNQKIIGDFYFNFCEKINLNNQINQTLESIAQALFKSWFVDFDPVRAKIVAKQEGNNPEFAAMCVISGKSEVELHQMAEDDFAELQATAALFPDELVESELGEVPKGWEVNSLGNICNFTPGSAFKPEYQGQTQGEIPFIKVSDMNLNGNEIFIVKANNYIDNSLQKERKFKLHEEGATVFAKIGVALISNRRRVLTMPTIIDNNMMSASPLKGLSTPYYLYLLLKTIDFNTLVSGTALPYLNVSDLRKILIVHPT